MIAQGHSAVRAASQPDMSIPMRLASFNESLSKLVERARSTQSVLTRPQPTSAPEIKGGQAVGDNVPLLLDESFRHMEELEHALTFIQSALGS